jgi:hypothetical protein
LTEGFDRVKNPEEAYGRRKEKCRILNKQGSILNEKGKDAN